MLALLCKAQIYFGNYFQKPKFQFGKILQTLKSPSIILGNILSKVQILVWQNFTNTQKPKYYPQQYFIKSPNISLAKFYKYSKGQILSLAIFYQKSNTILATSYQRPKTTTFLTNNCFKSPNIIWQIIFCSKPKVNTLATIYFKSP